MTLTDTAPDVRSAGLSGAALKLLAILAMTIDHIAYAFMPDGTAPALLMHTVGKLTGPIMFYLAAEGYHHTRSFQRYALRLLLFAAVSYFPYLLFCYGDDLSRLRFTNLNVIYTILLGVLAVHVRRTVRPMAWKIALMLLLACLSVAGDWGLLGFSILVVFDFYYGDFRNQAFAYTLIVLLDVGVIHLLTRPVSGLIYFGTLDLDLEFCRYSIEQMGMFLPLLLLRYYNGRRGGRGGWNKWFFYAYYPVHLLVLGLLSLAVYAG